MDVIVRGLRPCYSRYSVQDWQCRYTIGCNKEAVVAKDCHFFCLSLIRFLLNGYFCAEYL
jgi:hypothetical protein